MERIFSFGYGTIHTNIVSFNNKLSYIKKESGLDIKFDASIIKIEEVINYSFNKLNTFSL